MRGNMQISWEESKDIFYTHNRVKDDSVIRIKRKFINPKIYIEEGIINAKITNTDDVWHFRFGFEDMPLLDGTSTYIYIEDDDEIFRLKSKSNILLKNFNNIKCVWYKEEYVYYFRNTASKMGRLTFQKKIRASHETAEYGVLQRNVHAKYKHISRGQILIFEKECMRFEESGARLFERIYKYPNVFFVLSKESAKYEQLKSRYGKKIVSPDEPRYVKLVHTAKYYIGTELPMHLIGVRSPYKSLRQEIMNSNKHKFIFLQHGVMQSLSLAGANRNIFRKDHTYKPYKVVVSSQREADHFVDAGKYQPEDMWKIGLATYDNKRLAPTADKISVMLTWRPWDELKEDITTTTYYLAIKGIIDTIEDKEKIQLILHPKVHEAITEDNPLYKYLIDSSINEALSNSKVFITDYSSAVFDAFYRGANVIFWWVEKEACLKKYNNELLITEDIAFGDVVYLNTELNKVIEKNYHNPREKCFEDNYKLMVEFDDDQNTNRLIQKLLDEKILKNDRYLIK